MLSANTARGEMADPAAVTGGAHVQLVAQDPWHFILHRCGVLRSFPPMAGATSLSLPTPGALLKWGK